MKKNRYIYRYNITLLISYTPIQIKKFKKIKIKSKVQKIVISIIYDISKDIAIMYLYKLYVNWASQMALVVKNHLPMQEP